MGISREMYEKAKNGIEKSSDLFKRLFSDESYVKGDKIVIKSQGKKLAELELQNVCRGLRGIFKNLREELIETVEKTEHKMFDRSMKQTQKDKFMSVCISLLITSLKAETKLKSNNPSYMEIKDIVDSNYELVKSLQSTEDRIDNMLFLNTVAMESQNILFITVGPEVTFSADEAYELFKKMITKEEFKSTPGLYPHFIVQYRTELLKKLEKGGYLEPNNSIYIPIELFDNVKKNLNYEERYLITLSNVDAYLKGLMDLNHLKKNFNIDTFFDPRFLYDNKCNEENEEQYREYGKTLMKILEEVDTDQKCSTGFWNFYVNGLFSKEQLAEAAKKNWFSPIFIIEEYINASKKAINRKSSKTDEQEENVLLIDDEQKILEFFDTNILSGCITSYRSFDSVKDFINNHVAVKYEQEGKNFQEELLKGMDEFLENYGATTEDYADEILNLYTEGYIDFDLIKSHQFSGDKLEKIKERGITNPAVVNTLYNFGMINQDDIFENYEEDDVFALINGGMNADVLLGYYSPNTSTQEIISLIKSGKIGSTIDLSSLKPDINIGEIIRMYQPVENENYSELRSTNTLSFDDLNMLVTAGLITAEEADEIDQAYNYNAEIDRLIEQGLIVGDKNGKKIKRREGLSSGLSRGGYGAGVISDRDKQALFQALDDEYIELELTSAILKNYSLVVMPKDKIAIMEPNEEGHGASYVMSIKLALEQIRTSENNGEIIDPLKEYANRTGIRSISGMETVNHRENWGYNIARKMKYIHKNMDSLIYSKDKGEEEKSNHKIKIENAQRKIYESYQKARLHGMNESNIDNEEK